jgi:hypothetical protein
MALLRHGKREWNEESDDAMGDTGDPKFIVERRGGFIDSQDVKPRRAARSAGADNTSSTDDVDEYVATAGTTAFELNPANMIGSFRT